LERDAGRTDALAGYLMTSVDRRARSRIAGGLQARGSERAWSLTGPYGTGKTAFGVFLSNLLGPATSMRRTAYGVLRDADPALLHAFGKVRLLPVVLTGERAPIDLLLVRALHRSLELAWSTRRGAKPAVLAET